MTIPVFSVIVPLFNAERTIGATLRSVFAQSWPDFEVIVIDDGSTDNSLNLALALARDDQRLRIISKPNGGVSRARNMGVEFARGRLIAFLDADDLWEPDKLAQHHAWHDADPGLAASYARIAFIDADSDDPGAARTQSTVPRTALTTAMLLGENPVCTTSNLVVRRDILNSVGGFATDMDHAEDQEWQLRALAGGHRITGIDRLLVGYRMNRFGLSADLKNMHDGWQRLATRYGDAGDAPRAQAIFYRYLARRALRAGAPAATALHYAGAGLRSHAAAFFDEPRRGALTLVAALAGPFLPMALRMRLFS
jgi:glycosyltransferase involved in cell wall biosynthesis